MKVNNYQFSSEEIRKLGEYRDNQSNSKIRLRFYALLMLAQGMSSETVAPIIGKSVYTIDYWFELYIREGIGRLDTLNYVPKQPYLSFFQINQVIIYVTWENPIVIRQVREYIGQKFGVSYCDDAVRKMLGKRGLKVLRPKKVPGKPPTVEEQLDFIEEYEKIRESQKPDEVILFTDAMHLIHQPVSSLCWGDPAFPPVLPTNSGRKRLNILGAYNPVTHSLIHLTGEENCNSDRVTEFLDLVVRSNPFASSITLYRDNAKYFLARKVREWLQNHPQVHIIALPAYAPNLNLIERFWKFAKEKLVNNKYIEQYKTFRAKVFRFLNHTSEYADELKKLMVEKFEIIYVNANFMPNKTLF